MVEHLGVRLQVAELLPVEHDLPESADHELILADDRVVGLSEDQCKLVIQYDDKLPAELNGSCEGVEVPPRAEGC